MMNKKITELNPANIDHVINFFKTRNMFLKYKLCKISKCFMPEIVMKLNLNGFDVTHIRSDNKNEIEIIEIKKISGCCTNGNYFTKLSLSYLNRLLNDLICAENIHQTYDYYTTDTIMMSSLVAISEIRDLEQWLYRLGKFTVKYPEVYPNYDNRDNFVIVTIFWDSSIMVDKSELPVYINEDSTTYTDAELLKMTVIDIRNLQVENTGIKNKHIDIETSKEFKTLYRTYVTKER